MRQNLRFASLFSLPLVLFFVGRETVSWRPRKVAGLPYSGVLAISPDERFVANASSDEQGLVTIRTLESGEEVKHCALRHAISLLTFSPDGRSLALGWRKITGLGNTKLIGVSLVKYQASHSYLVAIS